MDTIQWGWKVFQFNNQQHVIPLNDDRPHAYIKCRCCPEVEPNRIYTHHSFDGREAFENGERKPS